MEAEFRGRWVGVYRHAEWSALANSFSYPAWAPIRACIGRSVLRFSVSGQDTTEADIDRSVAAIARAAGGLSMR